MAICTNAAAVDAYRSLRVERPYGYFRAGAGAAERAAQQVRLFEYERKARPLGVPASLLTSLVSEQLAEELQCEACTRAVRAERGNTVAVLRQFGASAAERALVAFPSGALMDRIALAALSARGGRAQRSRGHAASPASGGRILQLLAAFDAASARRPIEPLLLWARSLSSVACFAVGAAPAYAFRAVAAVQLDGADALHVCANPHYSGGAGGAVVLTRHAQRAATAVAATRPRSGLLEWSAAEGGRQCAHTIRFGPGRNYAAAPSRGTAWGAPLGANSAQQRAAPLHCAEFGAHPRVLWCAAASTEVRRIDLRSGYVDETPRYRYITSRESCSPFDSHPRTHL